MGIQKAMAAGILQTKESKQVAHGSMGVGSDCFLHGVD
jgi:hypothetical protein